MEKTSFLLSIAASIGTIISIMQNQKLKRDFQSLYQQSFGNRGIQSQGDNVINNTGNNSTINRR